MIYIRNLLQDRLFLPKIKCFLVRMDNAPTHSTYLYFCRNCVKCHVLVDLCFDYFRNALYCFGHCSALLHNIQAYEMQVTSDYKSMLVSGFV